MAIDLSMYDRIREEERYRHRNMQMQALSEQARYNDMHGLIGQPQKPMPEEQNKKLLLLED